MTAAKSLFYRENYPIFQNKMYSSREAGIHCPKGNIDLIVDQKTGIIFNCQFDE